MSEGVNNCSQKRVWTSSCPQGATLLSLCLMVIFSGCLSHRIENPEKYKREGVQYGITKGNFFPRWWSFYERGRSFADGEFWVEAETDLRRAVSMRTTDKRMSRTYGVHYIRYFGNRELGMVLFEQGRPEEAIPYLIRSLQQDPTEKAQHFLNLCRRELARETTDLTNPIIHLDPIPQTTNSREIRVSGRAIDNLLIDSVLINGTPSGQLLNSNEWLFARTLSLVPYKRNQIIVTAIDSFGNKSTQSIPVTLDMILQ